MKKQLYLQEKDVRIDAFGIHITRYNETRIKLFHLKLLLGKIKVCFADYFNKKSIEIS